MVIYKWNYDLFLCVSNLNNTWIMLQNIQCSQNILSRVRTFWWYIGRWRFWHYNWWHNSYSELIYLFMLSLMRVTNILQCQCTAFQAGPHNFLWSMVLQYLHDNSIIKSYKIKWYRNYIQLLGWHST